MSAHEPEAVEEYEDQDSEGTSTAPAGERPADSEVVHDARDSDDDGTRV